MKKIYPYLIVLVISAFLGAFGTWRYIDKFYEDKIEIVRDTVIQVRVDSIPFTVLDTVKTKTKPVKIVYRKQSEHDTVPPKPDEFIIILPDSIPSFETDTIKSTKYYGTETLTNGIIDYEIVADKLIGYKFWLTTKDTTFNNTTTITKMLPPRPSFYLGGGPNFTMQGSIQSVSLDLLFKPTNKLIIGLESSYDTSGLLPSNNNFTLGAKVYFKL